jgi:gliding motility-associated-like protein
LRSISIIILFLCFLSSVKVNAQNSTLLNSGAEIKVFGNSTPSSQQTLSVFGDFENQPGIDGVNGTIALENNGNMYVTGDWSNFAISLNPNPNVFTTNSTSMIDGVVTLENATNTQYIRGSSPTFFENLVINGSRKILLNNNNSVNNILYVNSPLILNTNTFEIKNPNPTGINYHSGFIKSETLPGNHGYIKWNTGNYVGTFTIPFGSDAVSQTDDLKLSVNIQQSMNPTDFFNFATYPTDMYNQPLPFGASPLETEVRKVVDRYWLIEPSNTTNLPNLDITFSYASEDVSKTKNSLNTDKLRASRNNTTLGQWLDMKPRGENNLNTVEIKDVTSSEFYNIWTLVNNPPVLTSLFMGDAFSPNGDGLNDVFLPIFQVDFEVIDYEFIIFNRWGKIMFRTKDKNEGWNGIPQGTNAAPLVDVYSWVIYVKGREIGDTEAEGRKQKFTGKVTIVL